MTWPKPIIRIATAGSVDDGKSTLIGRLLYETDSICIDQLQGSAILSDVVDGLKDERVQGITIDVAYKYFSTPTHNFILADAPGHVQYTRNMVTAISTADIAILLIDANLGITSQTKRHTCILNIFKIKKVVVAINKLDALNYSEGVFLKIKNDFSELFPNTASAFIPISALNNDNIIKLSNNMSWYKGATLLQNLIESGSEYTNRFLAVQGTTRDRIIFGCNHGKLALDQQVLVLPNKEMSTISNLYVRGDAKPAVDGYAAAISIKLKDHVDIRRGCQIVPLDTKIKSANIFNVTIICFDDDVQLGQKYLYRSSSYQDDLCVLSAIDSVFNQNNTLWDAKTTKLKMNDIFKGVITLYNKIYVTSNNFILVDLNTNKTIAAGIIDVAFYTKESMQVPPVIWLTGLSGSGKTTIARHLFQDLLLDNKPSIILDGDEMRDVFNNHRYDKSARLLQAEQIIKLAKLVQQSNIIPIVSLISPYRESRQAAKKDLPNFIEVYLNTSLSVCQQRDVKGLYKTGVLKDAYYEASDNPNIILDTSVVNINECVAEIKRLL